MVKASLSPLISTPGLRTHSGDAFGLDPLPLVSSSKPNGRVDPRPPIEPEGRVRWAVGSNEQLDAARMLPSGQRGLVSMSSPSSQGRTWANSATAAVPMPKIRR